MGSLRRNGALGKILHLAVASCVVLCSLTPARAGDHKQKVLVPVYTVPTTGVAMAPVASYSAASYSVGTVAAAPVAGAPVAMAPVNGGFGGVYYSSTAVGGAQVAMAPTTMVYTTANAPQVVTNGVANAPMGSTVFGNAPTSITGSRLTSVEAKRDVLDDLRAYYQQNRSSQTSRTAFRRALKDEARDRYVEAIAKDEVAGPEDLNASENQEIDQMVDLVMREDPSSSGNAPTGYTYGPPFGTYGPPLGTGFAPQPMMYYYVYPVAPAGHPHLQHLHHHLHHQKYVMP